MARRKPRTTTLKPRVTSSKIKRSVPASKGTYKQSRQSRRVRGRSPEHGLLDEGGEKNSQRPTQAATRQSTSQFQELEDPASNQNHPITNGSGGLRQPVLRSSPAPAPPTRQITSTRTSRTAYWVLNSLLPEVTQELVINTMSILPPPLPITTPSNCGRTPTPEPDKASSSSNFGSSDQAFLNVLEDGHPFVKSYLLDYEGVDGEGPNTDSMDLCRKLWETRPTRIPDPRYDDKDIFKTNLKGLASRNKAKLRHGLSDFVCPSAEGLAARIRYDADLATVLFQHYDILADAIDEQWHRRSAIFEDRDIVTLPKPDYCVGFKKLAFSTAQQEKLFQLTQNRHCKWQPISQVFFPFLTCEARKTGALEDGDNQNAHSMTLAIMAVVELFTAAQCRDLLRRLILGFSITYNGNMASLYCHYPEIRGDVTEIYRTSLGTFRYDHNFYNGRWKSYNFVRNIYEVWAPIHFERLCRALDRCNRKFNIWDLPSNNQGNVTPSKVASIAGGMTAGSDTSTITRAERPRSSTSILNSVPHQLPLTKDITGHLVAGSTIESRVPKDGSIQPPAAPSQSESQRPSGNDDTNNNEKPRGTKRKFGKNE